MPCMSYEDDYARNTSSTTVNKSLLANNDKLARIACKALIAIENGTPLEEVLKDKETASWWKDHKKADERARKEQEKKDALIAAKQAALSKLTPEEIKALGIKEIKAKASKDVKWNRI